MPERPCQGGQELCLVHHLSPISSIRVQLIKAIKEFNGQSFDKMSNQHRLLSLTHPWRLGIEKLNMKSCVTPTPTEEIMTGSYYTGARNENSMQKRVECHRNRNSIGWDITFLVCSSPNPYSLLHIQPITGWAGQHIISLLSS